MVKWWSASSGGSKAHTFIFSKYLICYFALNWTKTHYLLTSFKYLDCIWIQIKKLEDNDWKENQIYRPYLSFDSLLSTATPVNFPLIVPPEFNEQTIFPLPRTIFRMFDYTDVPEVNLHTWYLDFFLKNLIQLYFCNFKGVHFAWCSFDRKISSRRTIAFCYKHLLFGS